MAPESRFEVRLPDWLRRPGVLLAGLVLVAAVLRGHNLGARSFWLDEAWDLITAQQPLSGFYERIADNVHPPLYHLLLGQVVAVLGTNEISARLISFIFGVAVVPVVFLLGRALAGPAVGLAAAALTAVSPYLVSVTHAGRMYMLFLFLSCLTTWLLLRRMEGDTWTLRAGYIAGTLLCAYTHYMTLVVILAQLAMVLVHRARQPRLPFRLLIDLLLVELCYLPWLPVVVRQLAWHPGGPRIADGEVAGVVSLWHAFGRFANNDLTLLSPLLFALLLAAALARGKRAFVMRLGPLLLVVVAAAGIATSRGTFFAAHYFLYFVPLMLVGVAYALVRFRRAMATLVVVMVLAADQGLCTAVHWTHPPDPTPWRRVAALAESYAREPNLLIVLPRYSFEALQLYGLDTSGIPMTISVLRPRQLEQTVEEALSAGRGVMVLGWQTPLGRGAARRLAERFQGTHLPGFGEIEVYTFEGQKG